MSGRLATSAALFVATAVMAGCHGCSSTGGGGASGGSGPQSPIVSITGNQVTESHGTGSRGGVFVRPSLSARAVPSLTLDDAFDGTVSGAVYAQPLYVESGGKKLIIVATESDLVYALDADTGKVVWKVSVGTSVPQSSLKCGNIDPLGVTGTPAIDTATGSIFLDAMTSNDGGATKKHLIYSLAVNDGSVRTGWPVDVAAAAKSAGTSFNVADQNQRTALTFFGGRVFAGYGGHFGDCGDYHGWLVGVNENNPADVVSWATRAAKGGIWAPGGVITDGSQLYAVTGNTDNAAGVYGDGNSVIKFDSNLRVLDFFAPTNWQALDDADKDLGGANPQVLNIGGRAFVMALGKDGNAYLVARDKMGGVSAPAALLNVTSSPIISEPASYAAASGIYSVFRAAGANCPGGTSGDLVALKAGAGAATDVAPSLSIAWCAAQNGRGSPVVTSVDGTNDIIVWSVGAEGDEKLHAFDGLTGREIWASSALQAPVTRFQVPLAANDRVYVAATGRIFSFKLGQ